MYISTMEMVGLRLYQKGGVKRLVVLGKCVMCNLDLRAGNGGNGDGRTGGGREGRELELRASKLEVSSGERGRELDVLGEGLGNRDDIGAVNEFANVLSKDLHLRHGGLELAHHELLVVDHRLPEARSTGITREDEIGLETHLSGDGRENFTRVGTVLARELSTLEENLEEDLGVEGADGRIEGSSGDGNVNDVGSGNGVRGEESNGLLRAEASISEASQDARDIIGGFGDGKIGSGGDGWGTTRHELELGGTRTVGGANGTSKVDEVTSSQASLKEDRELTRGDVGDTLIGVERFLGGVELENGTISSSSLAAVNGETNGVVEGQTDG